MSDFNNGKDEFLQKCISIIEENLSNELFGVSELAREMGMSRSYLHRKINSLTKTSASQFIRQIRLKHAREMLRQTSLTVSEVAFNTGFSSVTYFSKCFRDYYGYPPGQVGNRNDEEETDTSPGAKKFTGKKIFISASVIVILILIVVSIFVLTTVTGNHKNKEIRIAVTIWEDNSLDSLDMNFISGINDYVRGGLMHVNGLTVMARRTVIIYENNLKSPKELGKKLNVDFVLDARGHTTNNKIELNVELFDAVTGDQVWNESFYVNRNKVIAFQPKLTQRIINEGLGITLTKDEKRKIEKVVTENFEANNYYLQGLYFLNLAQCNYMCNHQDPERLKYLENAKKYFESAVYTDSIISKAYAHLAKIYYYMGIVHDTVYREQIQKNAERAIHYDMNSEEAQIAMAYSCLIEKNYEKALVHLNLAVDINSNSAEAIGRLVFIYGWGLPEVDKFVEYAIKNVKINNGITEDKVTSSVINFCAAAALFRGGFFKEAEPFCKNALEDNPEHTYAYNVQVLNMLFQNPKKIDKVLDYLIDNHPPQGYSIKFHEEVGHLYYLMEDYENAYKYFNLQIEKYGEIGGVKYVLSYYHTLKKLGKDVLANKFKDTCMLRLDKYSNDIYTDFNLSAWYCITEDKENALKHLRKVAQWENGIPTYRIIYELYYSPMFENLQKNNEFWELRENIEKDFNAKHDKMKKYL